MGLPCYCTGAGLGLVLLTAPTIFGLVRRKGTTEYAGENVGCSDP
jgi:hypothetical protein